ncbi:MAG: hypothetical protein ABWY25_07455 [Paenisporosarcina sp.]
MSKKIEIEETKKDLRMEIKRLKRNRNIERGLVIITGIVVTVFLKKIGGERLAYKMELEDARDFIADLTSENKWLKEVIDWIED